MTSDPAFARHAISNRPRAHAPQTDIAPLRLVPERILPRMVHLLLIPLIQHPLPAPAPSPPLLNPRNPDPLRRTDTLVPT
ncbi:hypothetical protein LTR66_002324, partial [Elasticomyces elasticus]